MKRLIDGISSMFMEGGKISHKRVISVLFGLVGAFVAVYSVLKYKEFTLDIYHTTLIFVLIMSGVATVAQLAGIWKGNSQVSQATAPDPKPTEDKPTPQQ